MDPTRLVEAFFKLHKTEQIAVRDLTADTATGSATAPTATGTGSATGPAWRTVEAIVNRELPDPLLAENRTLRPRFVIWIRNNAVTGIAAGFDKSPLSTEFAVALRVGGSPDRAHPLHCTEIVTQDEGMLNLELR